MYLILSPVSIQAPAWGATINIDRVALQIAERLREKATRQGRIPFEGGDLRKSLQVEDLGRGIATVGSNLAYARAVHDGRKAITIRPNLKKNPPRGYREHRNPKKARLVFEVGGHTVYARKVSQPARKGQPFLREAAEEIEIDGYDFLMPGLMEDVGEEISRDFSKEIKILKFHRF